MRATLVSALVVALGLTGCPGKDGGSSEAVASPADDAKAEADAAPAGESKSEAEAKTPSGLAASVQQQVDEARGGAPASAAPPVVEAGAPLLAVVNGVPIPKSAFDAIYALKVKKYADRGRTIPETADRRYRKSIGERLVHHERLRQEVAMRGVDYDPAELAARQERQKKGIRDWDKHLERRGETEESLRDMVVAELREIVVLDAQGRLTVSPTEIEEDYEKIKDNWVSDKPRVRAAHILIPLAPTGAEPTPASEAAAEAEAKRIHALATAPGADFAALAREHSTGPSATKGGDIGIFTHDRMVPEFSDVAFSLAPGSISEPLETKFGFHIIKVLGKWPAGPLPKDALEDQITDRLRQRKLHQGRRELKDELEAKYPVTHHVLTAEDLAERPRRRRGEREEETKAELPAP